MDCIRLEMDNLIELFTEKFTFFSLLLNIVRIFNCMYVYKCKTIEALSLISQGIHKLEMSRQVSRARAHAQIFHQYKCLLGLYQPNKQMQNAWKCIWNQQILNQCGKSIEHKQGIYNCLMWNQFRNSFSVSIKSTILYIDNTIKTCSSLCLDIYIQYLCMCLCALPCSMLVVVCLFELFSHKMDVIQNIIGLSIQVGNFITHNLQAGNTLAQTDTTTQIQVSKDIL